jgi:site-specific DNA-methyltransferase (adenine-specific)
LTDSVDRYVNKILKGDCLKGLGLLPDDSIDLIVTDPPYQLDSIRKRWSRPGNSELDFDRWAYHRVARGFMGSEWDVLPSVEVWRECLRVLKPGAFAFVMCTPRQDSLLEAMTRMRDAGFVVGFSSMYWTYANGLPKAQSVPKAIDKRSGDYVPSRPYEPRSAMARVMDGAYAGFQPKPAVEVIIVVMKPMTEDTYVSQAMENGKGVTWLDDARVPFESEGDRDLAEYRSDVRGEIGPGEFDRSTYDSSRDPDSAVSGMVDERGRFPANLLVSDDVFGGFQDKGTAPHPVFSDGEKRYDGWGSVTRRNGEVMNYGDAGSYSRYFSLDAWWERACRVFVVPKPQAWERTFGLDAKSRHPTMKPLKLMAYLVTVGSRPGDVVLDPFLGTGTTAVASLILGRSFVGMEADETFCRAASRRVRYYLENRTDPGFSEIRDEMPVWDLNEYGGDGG